MEKENIFTVYPIHATAVGFWHDVCEGCSYKTSFFGNEDDNQRVKECRICMDNSYKYYESRKPVIVSRDENGRHIIKPYE